MEVEFMGELIRHNLEGFYSHLSKHIVSKVTNHYIHLDEYPYKNIIFLRNFNEETIASITNDPELRKTFPTIIFHNNDTVHTARLKDKGFIPLTRWKGMAITRSLTAVGIPGLEIIEVKNPSSYKQWKSVAYPVFHSAETEPHEMPYSRLYGLKESKLFLGLYNNKAACIGALFETGTTSGIYFIGTHPEFRGLGLGSAITRWLTSHARKELIVLQASFDGHKMYLKLGFGDFCNFDLYRFMPDEN